MRGLTRRGRIVLIYLPLSILALIALLWVSANLWWTGTGYCIGSMAQCFH